MGGGGEVGEWASKQSLKIAAKKAYAKKITVKTYEFRWCCTVMFKTIYIPRKLVKIPMNFIQLLRNPHKPRSLFEIPGSFLSVA
jgi:hypothetical protein